VSVVWLLLAILSFTGASENNSAFVGVLWVVGAVTFAISAIILGKSAQASEEGSAK
jgi:hypothetical protein